MLGPTKSNTSLKLTTNPKALLENIRINLDKSRALTLFGPYLTNYWFDIESELISYGIKTVLSSNPQLLEGIHPSLTRVLKPPFPQESLGSAIRGVIPVINSFNECAALSNLAQMYNKRLSYFFRVATYPNQISSYIIELERVLSIIKDLPLISLTGIYADFGITNYDYKMLKQRLHSLGLETDLKLYQPILDLENSEAISFMTYEPMALGKGLRGVFPYEISFQAQPIGEKNNKPIYHVDAGLAQGLPSSFPISVPHHKATLLEVESEHFLFKLEDVHQGPFPIRGYLTGGDLFNPVDISEWKKKHLIALLNVLS